MNYVTYKLYLMQLFTIQEIVGFNIEKPMPAERSLAPKLYWYLY
jgi:hypothetical protein